MGLKISVCVLKDLWLVLPFAILNFLTYLYWFLAMQVNYIRSSNGNCPFIMKATQFTHDLHGQQQNTKSNICQYNTAMENKVKCTDLLCLLWLFYSTFNICNNRSTYPIIILCKQTDCWSIGPMAFIFLPLHPMFLDSFVFFIISHFSIFMCFSFFSLLHSSHNVLSRSHSYLQISLLLIFILTTFLMLLHYSGFILRIQTICIVWDWRWFSGLGWTIKLSSILFYCISEIHTVVTLKVSKSEWWWNREREWAKHFDIASSFSFFNMARLLQTGMHKNTHCAPAPRWWKDERGQHKALFTDSLHTITFIFHLLAKYYQFLTRLCTSTSLY